MQIKTLMTCNDVIHRVSSIMHAYRDYWFQSLARLLVFVTDITLASQCTQFEAKDWIVEFELN